MLYFIIFIDFLSICQNIFSNGHKYVQVGSGSGPPGSVIQDYGSEDPDPKEIFTVSTASCTDTTLAFFLQNYFLWSLSSSCLL
jgi:hypothetical protein